MTFCQSIDFEVLSDTSSSNRAIQAIAPLGKTESCKADFFTDRSPYLDLGSAVPLWKEGCDEYRTATSNTRTDLANEEVNPSSNSMADCWILACSEHGRQS